MNLGVVVVGHDVARRGGRDQEQEGRCWTNAMSEKHKEKKEDEENEAREEGKATSF